MAQPKILWEMERKANVTSPYLEGEPTADTPASGTNNTQLATCEYVQTELAAFSPTDTLNTCGATPVEGEKLYVVGTKTASTSAQSYTNASVYISENNVLMGAAWNDYAEYRACGDAYQPGTVVCEVGDGTLTASTERLQAGPAVISDTFGFGIGKTDKDYSPVAVAGRVLVYVDGDCKVGDAVCAAPGGRAAAMTREEIREYPDRILGIVSEFPTYEIWNDTVEVKDRVWIRIK